MNKYNSCGYPKQNYMRQSGTNDNNCNKECGCEPMTMFPDCPVVAMAYVPFQQPGETYTCEKALMRGTLFPCLDKPFTMGCCR